jgi:uncharacterized BrkB/YihY/UPF0761 family membrane protein
MFLFITAYSAIADVSGSLDKTSKELQLLSWKFAPIPLIIIAVLYKRGKPEAKQQMESFLFGIFILGTVFGIVSLGKSWVK